MPANKSMLLWQEVHSIRPLHELFSIITSMSKLYIYRPHQQ